MSSTRDGARAPTTMGTSHGPVGCAHLEMFYPGDDLLEHFRFIRRNIRRDRLGAAAELRVVAARLVLSSGQLDPLHREAGTLALEKLEHLADRVDGWDPVKQVELDEAFIAIRLARVSVCWAVMEDRWQVAQALPSSAWGLVLVRPAEDLEHAVVLLGSELGRAVDPALAAVRALVASTSDVDAATSRALLTDMAVAEAALRVLEVPGIGQHRPRAG